MAASPMTDAQELFCALAGPMGSFLLLFFCRKAPLLALCGFVQGVFNLLPVFPLDGGRAMGCLLRLIAPEQGDRIADAIGVVFLLLIFLLASAASFLLNWGIVPLLAVSLLLPKGFLRKRPCKLGKIKVQ